MNRSQLFIFYSLFLVWLQGCGEFKVAPATGRAFSFDFSSMEAAVLRPASDKIDSDCMKKAEYDACLFLKNPVAQSSQPISGQAVSANLEATQIYGVKIADVTSTNRLENATFSIETLNGRTLSPKSEPSLKVKAQNDPEGLFSQLMAYYWLNRTSEYMKARTGSLPNFEKKLRVIVDDNFSGWDPRANAIHLKLGENGNPMAWSPEFAIHYFGLASLYHATSGAIDRLSTVHHRDCGLKTLGCCSTANGCARALSSGVGDYFSALMFPDQPTLGETWVNNLEGISQCGISRNLKTGATRTARSAFDACSVGGGEASALGSVYASIWWQIRTKAQSETSKGALEIDVLFMNHLYELDGADTFKSAKAKIRSLDQEVFAGRHLKLIEAEFAARGL